MAKPEITSFEALAPLLIQRYERYLPNAFDESLTLLQKVNMIIGFLEKMGVDHNNVVTQWNSVMEWILEEGLNESVDAKLDQMVADGFFNELFLSSVFTGLTNDVATLKTGKQKKHWIDVTEYGAKGDGVTDDTTSIQNAINAIGVGGTVFVPDGTYVINGHSNVQGMNEMGTSGGIMLKSNMTLLLSDGAILKAKVSNDQNYNIVRVYELQNVVIKGGTIQGDRSNPLGTRIGQWGYGVMIRGSKNITVEGVRSIDNWGDGFIVARSEAITKSEHVRILKCVADNNRRQGLSITGCDGGYIAGNTFSNTQGNGQPEAGIDLEPNYNETVRNIIIEGNEIFGNQYGIQIGGFAGYVGKNIIRGNVIRDNRLRGIWISQSPDNIVEGNMLTTNEDRGIHVSDPQSVNNLVTGNILDSNGDTGIVLYGSSKTTVKGNTLLGHADAIYLTDSNENIIEGNHTEFGIRGIYLVSNCNDNQILNNYCVNHSTYGLDIETNTSNRNRINGNHFQGGTAPYRDFGTNTKGTPKWVPPTTNDGYRVGDIIYHAEPVTGGNVAWVLTATGWKTFGLIN